MYSPKVIELIIEDNDEEAGLDGIALVELPAHEGQFEYFSKDKECDGGNCSHYVLSDEQIPKVIQMFHAFGEPQGLLESEGFKISQVRTLNKQEFQIISNPNKPSSQDTPDVRFRYKYVGPRDEKNRTFCAEMMRAKRVFRIEDIMEMSKLSVNEVGPDGYDIFTWRGSYNCRHKWVQLMYVAEGRIVNNTLDETGIEDEDGMPGPDTRTTATIDAGNTPPRTGFSSQNPDVSALSPYVDQITKKVVKKPVLATTEGNINVFGYNTKYFYICPVAVELFEHIKSMSMDDETIGMVRSAAQIADNIFRIEDDAIKNESTTMDELVEAAILVEDFKDLIKEIDDETGMTHDTSFMEGHLEKIASYIEQRMGLEDACWEGYEPIGLKEDGSPNCVPIKEEMNDDGNYIIGEYASYDDYPELIRKNAQAVLDYIERTGNPNNCMTQVGKVRAQQLAQGKPISIETVKRMKAYITRHKKDLETSKSYDDGCGKLAMDAWGGVEALNWVESTIKKYEEMNSDTEMVFSVFNSEQRLVVGPAMVPQKMIIRRNEITGEIYYVYFTEETIKKLQQKYMQEKLLDKANIEHGRKFLTGVDVVESWIVEDTEKDKQQVFGMNYPKGTWMITMKVNDDKTWQLVKDGKLKGFSVQGYFLEKAKFNSQSHKILQEIKNILKEII
jgi:hypothetical protein